MRGELWEIEKDSLKEIVKGEEMDEEMEEK